MYNPDTKMTAIDAIAERIMKKTAVEDKAIAYEIARRWSRN